MTIDLSIAMRVFNPNIPFDNPDNTYENLVILDGSDKPSLEQLEAAWATWEAEEAIRIANEQHQLWLTNQRALTRQALENKAERERLKYITPGAGKAMAYQQQRNELELWIAGERRPERLPIATAIAMLMSKTVQQQMNEWYTSVNQWLTLGALMEANLYKAKAVLMTLDFTTEQEFDDYVSNFNIYEPIQNS